MKNVSTLLLSLLTIVTCSWLRLCNSKKTQLSYDNIDPQALTTFFVSSNTRTWQHFVEEVTYPTRDCCANVMCAPRQQSHYPFKWNGYGSVARDIWRPLGPVVPPELGAGNPPRDPRVLLEEALEFFGPGAEFIFDDEGHVIGILLPEEGVASKPPKPTTIRPATTTTTTSRPPPPPPTTIRPSKPDNRGAAKISPKKVLFPEAALGDEIVEPAEPAEPEEERFTDVDICCRTRVAYFIVNTTLTDVIGITRTIAQYGVVGSYQFIRHGFCGSSGSCPGVCVPEFITIPLVIYPPFSNELVSYSLFKVPGYCTCRVSFFQGR